MYFSHLGKIIEGHPGEQDVREELKHRKTRQTPPNMWASECHLPSDSTRGPSYCTLQGKQSQWGYRWALPHIQRWGKSPGYQGNLQLNIPSLLESSLQAVLTNLWLCSSGVRTSRLNADIVWASQTSCQIINSRQVPKYELTMIAELLFDSFSFTVIIVLGVFIRALLVDQCW